MTGKRAFQKWLNLEIFKSQGRWFVEETFKIDLSLVFPSVLNKIFSSFKLVSREFYVFITRRQNSSRSKIMKDEIESLRRMIDTSEHSAHESWHTITICNVSKSTTSHSKSKKVARESLWFTKSHFVVPTASLFTLFVGTKVLGGTVLTNINWRSCFLRLDGSSVKAQRAPLWRQLSREW